MGKQIDKVDEVRNSTIEDCEKCDEENCDVRHCLISGPHEDKFPPKEKPKANFLWPFEEGSVEEAGYEFANARTEDYRYNWWKILLVRASEIEKIEEESSYELYDSMEDEVIAEGIEADNIKDAAMKLLATIGYEVRIIEKDNRKGEIKDEV